MIPFAPYIVVAWIAVTLYMFLRLSRPVAVIVACLVGSLLLPEVQWSPIPPNNVAPIRVPPFDFTKINCISYGLLLSWLICDRAAFRHIDWNRWDLPAVALGLYPGLACLLAGQSAQDAFSALRFSALQWTVPYVIGRLYLSNPDGCRRVVSGLVIGAIVYIPFCLLEMRISPQLHFLTYGFQQHAFLQVLRFGGYRPMVFMQHGLAVGLFMMLAAMSLIWLWRSGVWPSAHWPSALQKITAPMTLTLTMTALLCKSLGATVLGAGGLTVLYVSQIMRMRIVWFLLIAAMPAYTASRAAGWLRAETVISWIGGKFEQERTESFEFRLVNEDRFMRAMSNRQWTGMGNDPAARPKDHNGAPLIIDGQWMIEYFNNGVIGLVVLCLFLLTPALRFVLFHPPEAWSTVAVAPAAAAAMICTLLAIDCVPNAMLNPFYLLVVAALNGWNNGINASRHALPVPCTKA